MAPVGLIPAAQLFYSAQVNFLTKFSGYYELYYALLAAAAEQGWSAAQINSLVAAATAVEIVPPAPGEPAKHFRVQSRSTGANVAASWTNPANEKFSGMKLVRNPNRFPENDSDGVVLNPGHVNAFLDTGTTSGQPAFYRLVAEFKTTSGLDFFLPQSLFMREVPGSGPIDHLSEFFPFQSDLAFTQLTFTPAGDWSEIFASNRPADFANHRHYALSVATGVPFLPVARQNAATLNLPDDGMVMIMPSMIRGEIPFFGRLMDRLLVSANGFISPADPDTVTAISNDFLLNFPSYESHWAIPRISAFFADLSPPSGGDVWVRSLSDRFVVTFENVPAWNVFPPLQNTFQAELFFSGHIRLTYLDLRSSATVVGLSDGRGVPKDPDILPSSSAPILMSDLSNASATPSFGIEPIAIQRVLEGDPVGFTVRITGASQPAPTVSVTNPPPGATFNPVTREFLWLTGRGDAGSYAVTVRAAAGGSVATQNVVIIVLPGTDVPEITSIALTPEEPVSGGTLSVTYEYDEPNGVAEGSSDIYWYRNNAFVNGLTNQRGIPGEALKEGDRWYAVVVPRSALGITGDPIWSETVIVSPASKADINGDSVVDAVDIQLVINAVLGKSVGVLDADANLDGEINAADIQTVVNKALK